MLSPKAILARLVESGDPVGETVCPCCRAMMFRWMWNGTSIQGSCQRPGCLAFTYRIRGTRVSYAQLSVLRLMRQGGLLVEHARSWRLFPNDRSPLGETVRRATIRVLCRLRLLLSHNNGILILNREACAEGVVWWQRPLPRGRWVPLGVSEIRRGYRPAVPIPEYLEMAGGS